MIGLADFNLKELEAWLSVTDLGDAGKQAFRGGQIFKWIGLGANAFDEMTNIPAELRASLAAVSSTGIPDIVASERSARDGSVKYAMKAAGGDVVESVLMRYRHGNAVCVSSQAGCRMGCAFCASKPERFSRSLTPGEMLGQVAAIAKTAGRAHKSADADTKADANKKAVADADLKADANFRIGNVTVMGVGEPFDNYDNTLKFVRLLHEHDSLNIGFRKMTISTCGLIPGIARLAGEGLPVGLSVSLHAANDKARSLLMPVNRRYSIDKLIEACKIYTEKTHRRVTFEYAPILGVNDAPDDATGLLRLIRGMLCHINLIPLNKTEGSVFVPSPGERVARFRDILLKGGAGVTIRRGLGSDISAACGQLRNSAGAPAGERTEGWAT